MLSCTCPENSIEVSGEEGIVMNWLVARHADASFGRTFPAEAAGNDVFAPCCPACKRLREFPNSQLVLTASSERGKQKKRKKRKNVAGKVERAINVRDILARLRKRIVIYILLSRFSSKESRPTENQDTVANNVNTSISIATLSILCF